MKRIILTLLVLSLVPFGISFSQDNIYGDYIIYSFEKNVSLDLESAHLIDVLKMLSQQTKLNFISTEAVKDRKITLYLENAPLKEAMDILFQANNLAYDYYPESQMFVVKEMGKPTLELMTKVYRLKYIRVDSSRLEEERYYTISPVGGTTAGGRRGGGGGAGGPQDVEGEEKGLRSTVEQLLTEFGKVTEEPITNSLIVIDVPSQFPIIDEVINKLDIPMQRIMIEVEMLDVSKTHLDKLGFDFSNGLWGSYTGGTRSTSFPWPQRWTDLKSGEATLGTLSVASFTTIMKFLTEDTKTKFLARPKILTLSNETAEVNLTSNEVIGVTTTTTEGGTVTQDIEREDTGVRLRVTPQINPYTREITLFLEVFNRESVDSGIAVSGLTTGNLKNVEERGTKSIVRLTAGETLFIGGLIRKEDKTTVRKIPIIGDIPIIGNFFKYTERPSADNQERELLVFLTPRLLEDESLVSARPKTLRREQTSSSRKKSMEFALDSFSR